jgi:hypothetical protein
MELGNTGSLYHLYGCSSSYRYRWIDELKEYTQSQVTDEQFESRFTRSVHNTTQITSAYAGIRFKYNTPTTKEAFYYRSLFAELFAPIADTTVKAWVSKFGITDCRSPIDYVSLGPQEGMGMQ